MCKFTEFSSYLLAGDPQSTAAKLQDLSHSPCAHVRRRVAENPNTSLSTAIHLLRDAAVEVRSALTENEALLPLIAPDLARDRNSDVRFALAENINTPRPVLEYLSIDENPYVAGRALRTIARARTTFTYAA